MNRRLLVLVDGHLGVFSAKTATCLVLYRADDVVAVIDRGHAGRDTRAVLGSPAAVPIVGTLEEGLALGPDTLVIGIAAPGGQLPEAWRALILQAIRAGLHVVSGLHSFLADDPDLRAEAGRRGVQLVDLRRPPEGQPIAWMLARETRARRVLTVGTDCNVGKMVAAWELARAGQRRGLDARFLATGQTGMMLAGGGVTLDRIPGDFMAGHVERLVVEQGDADLVVVEGQGCLLHPAFSGVTLALLHGALPDAMILVHHAGRIALRHQGLPIPPLREWVRRYEDALAPLHPGRVVGIAVNPYGLDEREEERALREAAEETGLPVVNVLRHGADLLLEAAGAGQSE